MAKRYTIPLSIDFAVLVLRVGAAILILPHGWEKLQSILSGNWDFPDPLGIGSTASLFATVFAEFVCSIALLLGLLTRPAAAVLAFTMAVAAFIVHAKESLSVREHALLFLTIYIAIFLLGPGRFSMDQRLVNKYLKF
jgi:putative oxidoreductase